ncbi:MAG: hypothetical protein H0W86_09870 [Armatimonadetes bacterium]|nr:hypothetical protein [Armatimonadota bacterium]
MKRIAFVSIAVLAGVAASAQDGWKNPKAVSATIVERYAEQPEKKIDLAHNAGAISYRTSAGIEGQLEGIPRIETAGTKGVLTWIEGKPDVGMQLFAPTSYDVGEFLERPGFSRADLEFNLQGIEKTLSRKVLVGKSEAVAGRDCLVLKVLERPDSSADYQQLWIDRETGITMKQQDYFAGKRTYEREITSIEFKTSDSFTPSPTMKVLRGVVAPITLLQVGRLSNAERFVADIAKINSSGSAWASPFTAPEGYGYAQTLSRQVRRQQVALGGSQNSNNQQTAAQREEERRRDRRENRLRNRRFRSQDGDMFEIELATEASLATTVAVHATPDGERIVTFGGTAADGKVLTAGGAPGGTTGDQVFPFAKSDFVDPSTGHTLSLLQINGAEIEPFIDMLILGTPKMNPDNRLANSKLYSVDKPAKITAVTWTVGQVRYALISTGLPTDKLLPIAATVKKAEW